MHVLISFSKKRFSYCREDLFFWIMARYFFEMFQNRYANEKASKYVTLDFFYQLEAILLKKIQLRLKKYQKLKSITNSFSIFATP